ncbi:MAG: hypothetical protein FXV79_03615, partial [Candidatus Thioglobus sp.]
EGNILACQIAHTIYKVKKKIARIRTGEYLGNDDFKAIIPISFCRCKKWQWIGYLSVKMFC